MVDAILPHNRPAYARILVALTQRTAVREELVNVGEVLDRPEARAAFLRLARELGVEGLALNTLATPSLCDSLPADLVRELNARLEQLRREALLWDLERDRVLHALNRSGVGAVLLKGSALRERVYGDPVERSMGDLDFLVRPEEVEPAMAALRNAGYGGESQQLVDARRVHHFHQVLTHPRGFIVELHWRLTDPRSSVPLDEMQFISRASIVKRGSSLPVRVPSPEDLLLHTVSQNEDDAFGLLRRIVDIDRIVAQSPNVDWPYVVRAARDAGLDPVLAVSLRLAQLLLRTDVPSELARGAGLPTLARMHLAMMDPVAWVVSLPSERRAVKYDAMRLWCTNSSGARVRRAMEALRGDSLAKVLEAPEASPRRHWSVADSSARATKLGGYHLLVYWRSTLALASRSGRRRLRFWT